MTPNNEGQGAMALIKQLEEKARMYKNERDDWRYISTVKSAMFRLGMIVGMVATSLIVFIWRCLQ